MRTKADVQRRVVRYMREAGLKETELARRVRIPQATFNRMLADDPTYVGSLNSWRRLARFAPLHLDELEVLAAVGLGPAVSRSRAGRVGPLAAGGLVSR